ncbi:hypothetical protein BB558_000225 [Smittium angustum]|uniref:Nudix hydrolase domain-containing protein n=1 Tax=Smittium angustum TaxID=133377 RepID=A0A2U1JF16_SMIAN|nr:hypothetical protein BB558_000225 [Smittium angustum]
MDNKVSIVIKLVRSNKKIVLGAHPSSGINSTGVLERVRKFVPFRNWLEKLDDELVEQKGSDGLSLSEVLVQSVDEFASNKIGFVKFITNAKWLQTNINVPGIVFMRGGSVSILFIIRKTGSETGLTSHQDDAYVVLTSQPRIPVPDFHMLELPAGMLDGSGNFCGKAAEEIHEELGLKIDPSKLIDLTELAIGKHDSQPNQIFGKKLGFYPSSGGSDEFVRLLAYEETMDHKDILSLENKLGGLIEHGEKIVLRLVKIKDLWKSTVDMKATSSLYLWDIYQSKKKKLNYNCVK